MHFLNKHLLKKNKSLGMYLFIQVNDCMQHRYLQLALVAFDTLGGAKAFARQHLAHVGMAITFTSWKRKSEREPDKKMRMRNIERDIKINRREKNIVWKRKQNYEADLTNTAA